MDPTTLSLTEARQGFSSAINEALASGKPVYIQRHGRRIAAIIGAEELERLMELAEDMEDIRAAEEAREEMRRTGETPVPWDEVRANLGLT